MGLRSRIGILALFTFLVFLALPGQSTVQATTPSGASFRLFMPIFVDSIATSPPAGTPVPASAFTKEQTYSLDLHNQARAQHGVAALVLDAKLNAAATAQGQDMATRGYFSHNSPEEKTPWQWMTENGVTFGYAGQNLGLNYLGSAGTLPPIKQLFDMMMGETPPNDGHVENILNPVYKRLGVGTVISSTGAIYWVVDFTD